MALDELLAKMLYPDRRTDYMVAQRAFRVLLHKGWVTRDEITQQFSDPPAPSTLKKWLRDLQNRGVLKKTRVKTVNDIWQWRYEWGPDFKYIIEKLYLRVIKGRKT